MKDSDRTDAQLRAAMKRSMMLNHAATRRLAVSEGGLITPQAQASPEHYHLLYTVPKLNLQIPSFASLYVTSREAYEKIQELAQEAEPNVEYYDEGPVGMEMRLHDRIQLWWVVIEVAACIKSACTKDVNRAQLKKSLIVLPGDN